MGIRSVLTKLTRHHWDLAFVEPIDGDWLAGKWNYNIVKYPTKHQWFADPFILDVTDDVVVLLVEEFTYEIGRGRIAKLVVNRHSMKLEECRIILDLPTHLSFPAIMRKDGDIYIYPENNETGRLNLYRYDTCSNEIEIVKKLVDEPLTDAVLYTGFETPYIFSTVMTDNRGNGNILNIYKSATLNETFTQCGCVHFKEGIARNAGGMFTLNNKLIRPAQIFENNKYGVGLSFQEIIRKDGDIFINELKKRYPPKGYIGMHTFNMYKGVTVVDLCAKNYPFMSLLVETMFSVARMLIKRH